MNCGCGTPARTTPFRGQYVCDRCFEKIRVGLLTRAFDLIEKPMSDDTLRAIMRDLHKAGRKKIWDRQVRIEQLLS